MSTACPVVCGPVRPVLLICALYSGHRYPLVSIIGWPNSSRSADKRSMKSESISMEPQCEQAILRREKRGQIHVPRASMSVQCLARSFIVGAPRSVHPTSPASIDRSFPFPQTGWPDAGPWPREGQCSSLDRRGP